MKQFEYLISSSDLYHYTKDFETICKILNDGLKPSFNLEKLDFLNYGNKEPFEIAYPMVCFTDLTADKIKNHTKQYGDYYIALKKDDWAYKYHISPVVYCHNRSAFSDGSLKLFTDFYIEIVNGFFAKQEIIQLLTETENEKYQDYINKYKWGASLLYMYAKSYEGHPYNKNTKVFEEELVRFYDEREWRYIPIDGMHEKTHSMKRNEYENDDYRNKKNESMWSDIRNILKFEWDDISYIGVKKEDERSLLTLITHRFNISIDSAEIKIKIIE